MVLSLLLLSAVASAWLVTSGHAQPLEGAGEGPSWDRVHHSMPGASQEGPV